MLLDNSVDTFVTALQNLWIGVIGFLPQLVVAILIFIIGWIIAMLIDKGIVHFLKAVKFDHALKSAGFDDMVARGGFRISGSRLVGGIVKWFFIIVFLVAALDIVGLSQVNIFLQEVLAYLPQVLIAVLVILIASVIADALSKAVVGSARAADIRSANVLGVVVRWAIWIFAILIALAQLGIAAQFVQILFTGVVAMLAIAGGLAFGLGGKDAAGDALMTLRKNMKSHR